VASRLNSEKESRFFKAKMKKMITALHVDDDKTEHKLLQLKVKLIDDSIDVCHAASVDEAVELMKNCAFDCIVCDYQMPGKNGFVLLDHLRNEQDKTPFIMLTGQGSEELAAEAFHRGATDYFPKAEGRSHYTRLINSIQRNVQNVRELAQRRNTEQQLEEHKAKLEAILHCLPIGVGLLEGRTIVQCNQSFCDIVGYNEGEIIGKDVRFLYFDQDEYDRVGASKDGQFSVVKHAVIETAFRRKDGSCVDVLLSASPVEGEDQIGLRVGALIDISERKKLEAELVQSNQNIKALIENTDAYIWSIDTEYRLITCNTAFSNYLKSMLGIEVKTGDILLNVDIPDDYRQSWKEKFDRVLNGEQFKVEEQVLMGSETGKVHSYYMSPIKGVNGEITGATFYGRDNSERHLAEQALERANKDLESFSYSVSHDLKAPLRQVMSLLDLMHSDADVERNDDDEKYLNRIQSTVARMNSMINSLLDLSRYPGQELTLETFDLVEIAESEFNQLNGTGTGIYTHFEAKGSFPVNADRKLMSVVMQNLLSNAIKFSAYQEKPRVSVSTEINDGVQWCVVQDNGVGFDEKDSESLFVPFKRLHSDANYQGFGIGLSTVRRIIERHGGTIFAKSTVNAGASFYLRLGS